RFRRKGHAASLDAGRDRPSQRRHEPGPDRDAGRVQQPDAPFRRCAERRRSDRHPRGGAGLVRRRPRRAGVVCHRPRDRSHRGGGGTLPTTSPIGVAFLSAVRHASSYLPVLLSMPDVEVRAIGEERDAPAWAHEDARILGRANDVPVTDNIESLLARDDIQMIVVCSEPVRHARLAMAALDAGKHVVVDKPFATTLDDATALLQTVKVAPGRFTMMHRLFSPQIARARAAIDAGSVGLPLSLDLEWIASDGLSGEAVERPEFVTDTALSGGGEIMNFLTYPAMTLRYLTGAEVTSVYAEAGSFFFDQHKGAGVEDF